MGIAIILNSANFSAKNLGKVTIVQDVEVESMSIIAEDSYEGMTAQLTATYNPASTNQKGCTWSIVSGGDYASITTDGVLTIKSGANNSSVKVRATNTYNSNVYAEKVISVTYNDAADYLTSISISNGAAENNTIQFAVEYNPTNTMYKGVTWNIESGSEYAEIDGNGLLRIKSGASGSAVGVKATSTHDGTITDSKTIIVSYLASVIQFADPLVKQIVVSHADTDGDGEISSTEADAVTTMNIGSNSSWFSTNGTKVADIVSFDELGEFHNVKKLDQQYSGAFQGCGNLKSINLDNIEKLTAAFLGLTKFEGTNGEVGVIRLPKIVTIGSQVFSKCSKINLTDCGENLASVGEQAFNYEHASTFIFRGETPPTFNTKAFAYNAPNTWGANVVIYVPDNSIEAYTTEIAATNLGSMPQIKALSTYAG